MNAFLYNVRFFVSMLTMPRYWRRYRHTTR